MTFSKAPPGAGNNNKGGGMNLISFSSNLRLPIVDAIDGNKLKDLIKKTEKSKIKPFYYIIFSVFITIAIFLICFFNFRQSPFEQAFTPDPSEVAVPSQVWIYHEKSSQGRSCGGTLIKPNKVLTAAHCFDSSWGRLYVNYGSQFRLRSPYRPVVASRIDLHPDFVRKPYGRFYHDVAVITLSKDITEDHRVAYAQLATTSPKVGTFVTIFGWGAKSLEKNLYSDDVISKKLMSTVLKVDRFDSVTDRIVARMPGKTATRGFGGSAMTLDDGTVVGIASSTGPYSPEGGDNWYTDVSIYWDWIDQQ